MNIWNCDETRVQDVPKVEDIIGVTREKAHTMFPKEQGGNDHCIDFCECLWPSISTWSNIQRGKG